MSEEPTLKGRAGIYQIQAPDGQILTDGVTIQEACRLTGLSKSSIQQAAALGHRAGKLYLVQKVDVILNTHQDRKLLDEWESVRLTLLEYRRKKEKWEK